MTEKKGYTLRFPFRLAPGQEINDQFMTFFTLIGEMLK